MNEVEALTLLCTAQNQTIEIANWLTDEQKKLIDELRKRLRFLDSTIPAREMTQEEIVADLHILVDLDATLATYTKWEGADHIGYPITPMLKRVKDWIKDGKKVKIFTARAHAEGRIPVIKQWLRDVGLPDLEITCVKLPSAVEIWDDRAVQVSKNAGADLLGDAKYMLAAYSVKLNELHAENQRLNADVARLKGEIQSREKDNALLSEIRKMVGV